MWGTAPVLLLLTQVPGLLVGTASGSRRRQGLQSRAGWTGGGCPCANASLCDPIQRTGAEKVFAFHVDGSPNGSLADWKKFDWSQITTLCLYGTLSPELLCHAHAHGARITLGDGGTGKDFTDAAVDAWVNRTVQHVQSLFVDGINIDLEASNCTHIGNCDNPTGWSKEAMANLTRATAKVTVALHKHVPGSQVSFDTPSLGMYEEGAGGRGCGFMYGRNYDFKGLAHASDLLLSMDYDSNDPELGADPYNPWRWPGKGVMAATGRGYAQAGMPVVKAGIECYAKLGVPASKLVLAFPWYAYDYQCQETADPPPADAAEVVDWCHVTNAR
jgi:hypothetical protein